MTVSRELIPDFVFSGSQREALTACLRSVQVNPYRNPEEFRRAIATFVDEEAVPKFFSELCRTLASRDGSATPVIFMKNAPNDKERPYFDYVNPVQAKRAHKREFIAESFLELVVRLLGAQTITYANDNDGDFFHDVHPMEALAQSQSQKSVVDLGFHNDSANHFARPEWVNMLCMRNSATNAVYTTYVSNREVISNLNAMTRRALEQPHFYTPYDDLTVHGNRSGTLGNTELHPIVGDQWKLVFFEGRTVAHSEEGKLAVRALGQALHDYKYMHRMEPDDFVCIDNNRSLHGREVRHIADPEAHRARWLIKSYSVSDLSRFEHFFVAGRYGVVDG
jgi:hypothetical protein